MYSVHTQSSAQQKYIHLGNNVKQLNTIVFQASANLRFLNGIYNAIKWYIVNSDLHIIIKKNLSLIEHRDISMCSKVLLEFQIRDVIVATQADTGSVENNGRSR